MQSATATEFTKRFGFKARSEPLGFFLAPLAGGDDAMLVRHDGKIVVYEHDAQAFLAAKALQQHITTA
jgi:hypothetical protein